MDHRNVASHNEEPAAGERAEQAAKILGALTTAGEGGDVGLLTQGERAVLDFLWITVKYRAGLTSTANWLHLIPGIWRDAVEQVERELQDKEAQR